MFFCSFRFAIIGVISTWFLFEMKILMFSENKPNKPNQSQSEILQDNETTKATFGLVDSKKAQRKKKEEQNGTVFMILDIGCTDKWNW